MFLFIIAAPFAVFRRLGLGLLLGVGMVAARSLHDGKFGSWAWERGLVAAVGGGVEEAELGAGGEGDMRLEGEDLEGDG